MKAISLSGFILSILTLVAALINQFSFIPKAEALKRLFREDLIPAYQWREASDMVIYTGEAAIIAGGVALILCLIPAFKTKNKMAFAGIVFSIVGIVMGLAQGTHMFS